MIVSVKDVYKKHGKEEVLRGISFSIEEPEIVALVGPNGAGKSTLLNVMTNLLRPDRGEITFFGKSNTDERIFHDVSFMQDNSVLYDYLTGYDHLLFITRTQKLGVERIEQVAQKVGITSYLKKRVGHYSLGMKQHLLIAMALVNDPKLLIMDEPLNGLDPTSAIKVRDLLLELVAEGTTILLSSHNLAEIDRVTNHIYFLKSGQLLDKQLQLENQNEYTIVVDQLNLAKDILKQASIDFVQKNDELNIIIPPQHSLQSVVQLLMNAHITLLDIKKIAIGSEAYYREIFGG